MDSFTYVFIFIFVLIIAIIIGVTINNTSSTNTTMNAIEPNTFPFSTYIINMDKDTERYKYVTQQLEALGIKNYHRWKGFVGKDLTIDELNDMNISSNLGTGARGCAYSHMKLWQYILDNKLDWTLILEDDVHFH
ncbi:MAG: glycosyltransferase family 25 protein, partial [Nitrososphaeraceae archaeon]|nr:glycosyltransferase family 25 protein [Nitrososphaeraceae archaeon]